MRDSESRSGGPELGAAIGICLPGFGFDFVSAAQPPQALAVGPCVSKPEESRVAMVSAGPATRVLDLLAVWRTTGRLVRLRKLK